MSRRDLYDLEKRVREELREWAKENPDNTDPDYDGSLSEMADSAVPIYTSDLMQMAADDISLATDEPEIGPAFDGSPTPVNIVAANVYERLTAALWEEWREIEAEREEAKAEEEDEPATI